MDSLNASLDRMALAGSAIQKADEERKKKRSKRKTGEASKDSTECEFERRDVMMQDARFGQNEPTDLDRLFLNIDGTTLPHVVRSNLSKSVGSSWVAHKISIFMGLPSYIHKTFSVIVGFEVCDYKLWLLQQSNIRILFFLIQPCDVTIVHVIGGFVVHLKRNAKKVASITCCRWL